ncbi:hypothetical protein AN958_00514 [Leucoagaricus sp. SymC.cos]|nr:hypothetical protein AN958_00514 [Leucoagaricus sp. SymC.cos]
MPGQRLENVTLCSPRPSAFESSANETPTSPCLVTTTINSTILSSNHILIHIDYFGFSANNVTYQALGEHPHFRYFEFHPAPESVQDSVSPRTHGLIPVWGFGTIQASTHPKLSVGERVYGYFAPTRYLVLPISPKDVNKFAAYVPRPHLPADRRPYNQILRCGTDPQYNEAYEGLTMLYRPLFWTSFWFEDYLFTTLPGYATSRIPATTSQSQAEHINFLISSASSKTAFCLAYLIQTRISLGQANKRSHVVGLTSMKNVEFTKELGLYTGVEPYTADFALTLGRGGRNWIYVDVAGNDSLNAQLATLFTGGSVGPRLVKAVSLGLTNLSPASSKETTKERNVNTFTSSSSASLPAYSASLASCGIEFEQFFMPEWLSQRQRQIPVQEIFARQKKAWDALMHDCKPWLSLERVRGPRNVEKAYGEVVKGGVGPERGMIWSMWDEEAEKIEAKL